MRTVFIELKNHYPLKGGSLKGLIIDNPWDNCDDGRLSWKRPALIVVPGGGYYFISNREGDAVASQFFAKGFQVFVLEYLCKPDGAFYPEQLFELSCAIDYVKKHADDFFVNPDEIFTLGFSAGGHLVCDESNEYATVSDRLGVLIDCKPTAVALGYPVIDNHDGSFDNLLFGYDKTIAEKMKNDLRLNCRVGKQTPPSFVWTTAQDNVVDPANSLNYCLALSKFSVPFELHVYPKGEHGKATGLPEINYERDNKASYSEWKCLSRWVDDAIRFFKSFCVERL